MKEGIAVLLLFFNKVETTGLVLERILEAKPSVLLLAQDGARKFARTSAEFPITERLPQLVADVPKMRDMKHGPDRDEKLQST